MLLNDLSEKGNKLGYSVGPWHPNGRQRDQEIWPGFRHSLIYRSTLRSQENLSEQHIYLNTLYQIHIYKTYILLQNSRRNRVHSHL